MREKTPLSGRGLLHPVSGISQAPGRRTGGGGLVVCVAPSRAPAPPWSHARPCGPAQYRRGRHPALSRFIPLRPAYPSESHVSRRIPPIPANPTCPSESRLSRFIPAIPTLICALVVGPSERQGLVLAVHPVRNAHQCYVTEVHSHSVGSVPGLSDPTSPTLVMPGLDPGISLSRTHRTLGKRVDGRIKCGHDVVGAPCRSLERATSAAGVVRS